MNRCLTGGLCTDINLGARLMSHLGLQLACYKQDTRKAIHPSASHVLQVVCPASQLPQPLPSPQTSDTDLGYNSGRESSPSPSSSSSSSSAYEEAADLSVKKEPELVWRPF